MVYANCLRLKKTGDERITAQKQIVLDFKTSKDKTPPDYKCVFNHLCPRTVNQIH